MIIPLGLGNEINYTKCTFSSSSPYASFSQICAKYSRKLRKVISGVSESVFANEGRRGWRTRRVEGIVRAET